MFLEVGGGGVVSREEGGERRDEGQGTRDKGRGARGEGLDGGSNLVRVTCVSRFHQQVTQQHLQ